MACKLGCSFSVSFADSFEKPPGDFMAYSSALQRGIAARWVASVKSQTLEERIL
jgi:hypothetical protein